MLNLPPKPFYYSVASRRAGESIENVTGAEDVLPREFLEFLVAFSPRWGIFSMLRSTGTEVFEEFFLGHCALLELVEAFEN